MKDPLAFADAELDRLMGFFPRVDGKAAFLFALNIALLGLVALNLPFDRLFSFTAGWGLGSALLLSISTWQLYLASYPHLKSGATESNIFFGDIAGKTGDEFHAKVIGTSDDEHLKDVLCQVHRNAEILSIKFERVHTAHTLTLAGVALWLIFVGTLAGTGVQVKWTP